MPEDFPAKLDLTLKALSTTRGRLAADLAVDKSVVGKWTTGAAAPSAHNLAKLSQLIARQAPGFTSLDWERDLEGLAEALGVPQARDPATDGPPEGFPLSLMSEIVAATERRASAYEGFYRSTRPFAAEPGKFINDVVMVRRAANGLLRMMLGAGGVTAEGWIAPLGTQIFVVGSELTSGSLVFAILNGVPSVKVTVLDGVILSAILDPGRTITSTAVVFERTGDLTDDTDADDRRFQDEAAKNPVRQADDIPQDLRDHLTRDIGPAAFAAGGDLLLRMPVARSWAR
jgi:hypothetical protein